VPDRDVPQDEEHPVAAGLIALLGVGLVVGLIAGLAALAGTQLLGLGGDDASAQNTSADSLYLPKPRKTTGSSGPLITLAPGETGSPGSGESKSSEQESPKDKKPKTRISLSASQTEVAPMQQIDLTGVYPGGEGAILRVERFYLGSWEDFAQITANVSDETFATYIQTGQIGKQRFRMVDTDTGRESNAVTVRVR
jgi:hypothetical protein